MEGRGIGEHVIMCNDTVCSCLTQTTRNIPLLTIEMAPNPLYERHKPIRCAPNAAYNDVKFPLPDKPLPQSCA